MRVLFKNNKVLTESNKAIKLPQLKVKSCNGMFSNYTGTTITRLELLDTSECESLYQMFYGCSNLQSLDLSMLNTRSVTTMAQMFMRFDPPGITTLDLSTFDTSNVKDMSYMFYGISKVITLDMSNFDMSNVTNVSNMFVSCTKLTNFTAPTFYISISFSSCTSLSHDSLMSIINNLATVSTTQTLTLGSTNLAKLTDDEKATATGRGWTLA